MFCFYLLSSGGKCFVFYFFLWTLPAAVFWFLGVFFVEDWLCKPGQTDAFSACYSSAAILSLYPLYLSLSRFPTTTSLIPTTTLNTPTTTPHDTTQTE
jgi:hypothetical protein